MNEMIWGCNIGVEEAELDRVPVIVQHTWSFPRGNRDQRYER